MWNLNRLLASLCQIWTQSLWNCHQVTPKKQTSPVCHWFLVPDILFTSVTKSLWFHFICTGCFGAGNGCTAVSFHGLPKFHGFFWNFNIYVILLYSQCFSLPPSWVIFFMINKLLYYCFFIIFHLVYYLFWVIYPVNKYLKKLWD